MDKKELDELERRLDDEGITEDTEATSEPQEPDIPDKQDTTPEFLTEEEQAQDDELFAMYPVPEEKQ